MDIRVYDFDFNLLGIMSDVISSTWCIKYNGIGTYDGHFRLTDSIADVFLKNKYLVIIEGENQAVCTGKVVSEELLICGRTVNWLLEKRVIPPFKTREIFGENYVTPYAIGNMVLERAFTAPPQIDDEGAFVEDSIDEQRLVENFTLPDTVYAETLDRHFWRNSANTVETIMTDISDMLGLGHRLVFNIKNKSWDFEYISGIERNILVCEQNRNLYNSTYTVDLLDDASGGWYAIYSADSDEEETEENSWRYIKKNSTASGMRYWEAALEVSGASEAESKMAKKTVAQRVQGTLSKLKYKTDYDMGDIIRVLVKYGNFKEEIKYRITGVNLWINKNGRGEEPVLTRIEEE